MAIDKIKLKKINAQRPLQGFNSRPVQGFNRRPLQLAQQPHHNQEGVAPTSLTYNEQLNLLLPFLMQKFEDDGDEFDYRTAQLEPYETGSYQAARRLQFSEEDSLAQLTPLGSRLMRERGRATGRVLIYRKVFRRGSLETAEGNAEKRASTEVIYGP
ncbi:hypothetical protein KY290_010702 [Solanum tuberosum]|uniref:Uncharacterized protein n=1 Tax=Solanum tuberosum TaxID=4113 RepID=A0ABQ7W0K7_SOLTU|nr:hypothetical protein KY290_010702 [Solanum tuberosum]